MEKEPIKLATEKTKKRLFQLSVCLLAIILTLIVVYSFTKKRPSVIVIPAGNTYLGPNAN